MTKGFGAKKDEQLGYILVLMPEVNAYAGKFSLDFPGNKSDEIFIGLTSMLEEAQVWKSQKLAKQASEEHYSSFIFQQLNETPIVEVQIKRLKRLASDRLEAEMVESIHFTNDQ